MVMGRSLGQPRLPTMPITPEKLDDLKDRMQQLDLPVPE